MYEFESLWRSVLTNGGGRRLRIDAPFLEQLEEVRPRTIQAHLGGAVALGTDMGLNRDENEDRVIAAQSFHPSLGLPIFVAAVADGMGGMLDGGGCATLGLSVFIENMMAQEAGSLGLRLTLAAKKANDAIFDQYRGRGGTTLSAIAVDSGGHAIGLNVGDSRIYASTGKGLVPLTVDDTLSAAFGGEGTGLIQFIGVGQGLRSHLIDIPTSAHSLFITSDGAHFPDAGTFGELMQRSPDPKGAVERGLALARWLGSPDNASLIAIDLGQLRDQLAPSERRLFAVLGLSGATQVLPPPGSADGQRSPLPPSSEDSHGSENSIEEPKKRTRSKKKKSEKQDSQLQIEITPVAPEKREDSE